MQNSCLRFKICTANMERDGERERERKGEKWFGLSTAGIIQLQWSPSLFEVHSPHFPRACPVNISSEDHRPKMQQPLLLRSSRSRGRETRNPAPEFAAPARRWSSNENRPWTVRPPPWMMRTRKALLRRRRRRRRSRCGSGPCWCRPSSSGARPWWP